jgi:hypothetical protein
MLGRDGYRFQTGFGIALSWFVIIFLNITLLNLLIAITGEEYSKVLDSKK